MPRKKKNTGSGDPELPMDAHYDFGDLPIEEDTSENPPREAKPEGSGSTEEPQSPLGKRMDTNFLEYASYVIRDRAIPSLVDGLKPVQRRIMWSLHQNDDGKFIKVANIVGHCMQYHPHGDASISDALVVLTNKQYLMASSGYQFKPVKDLEVQINLPSWIKPSGMVHITPTGIQSVPHRYKEGKLVISVDLLNDAAIIVAPNAQNAEDVYQARLRSILSDEDRDFSKGMCALVECRMQRHAQPEIQSSEEVMPLAIGADVDEVLHIVGEVGAGAG